MGNDTVLAATEVKNRFGRVLREVMRTGGPVVVERSGKPIAVILSVEAFNRLRPRADGAAERGALGLAAFGMWADRADISEDWLERGRARWHSEWADG